MNNNSKPVEDFVKNMKDLLRIEKEAEIQSTQTLIDTLSEKELISRGLLLNKLEIVEQCTGLYGKFLLMFEPKNKETTFKKSNRFQPGDIIGVKNEAGETIDSGVVFRIWERRIQIALKQPPANSFDETGKYSLVQLINDITYKRMDKALRDIQKCQPHLLDVIFGISEPTKSQPVNFEPKNPNLNPSQIEAISFALGINDLALIHGPPGTGKTTTIAELILQSVKRGERVLACAPSNIAVDNIAEKLIEYKDIKIIRIGHPARFLPAVAEHCLDIMVSLSNGGEVVREMRREMDQLQKEITKCRGATRDKLWGKWKENKQELKQRERKAVTDTLNQSQVILATCTGVADRFLDSDEKFDLVIIDEAGQALEAQCWIPILKAKKLILAGDHQQLPPTIHSEKVKKVLEKTLFEKLIINLGDRVSKMLLVQYRMNSAIMSWSSHALYNDKIVAHQSVTTHLLSDLETVSSNYNTLSSLVLIDTVGCNMFETEDSEGSKSNEGEAQVVVNYIDHLIASGLQEKKISIISPYFAQVRLLRGLLKLKYPQIEINTVDGFQGREQELIIISMVRSNESHEVGFLKEDRRMNVAVTRARRQCCIICDTDTVSSHPFLNDLCEYFQTHGEYLSAEQYVKRENIDPTTKEDIPSSTYIKPHEKPKKIQSDSSTINNKEKELYNTIKNFSENSTEESFHFKKPLSRALVDYAIKTTTDLSLYPIITRKKGQIFLSINRYPPPEDEDEEDTPEKEDNQETTEEVVDEPEIEQTEDLEEQPKTKLVHKQKPIKKKIDPSENVPTNNKKNFDKKWKAMDDDAALDYIIQSKKDTKCRVLNCKETNHFQPTCPYCKERYCLNHSLPESHGCGADARKAALNNNYKTPNSNTKKLNEGQHKYLERSLHNKIEASAQARSKKVKQTEDKSGRGRGSNRTTARRGRGGSR